MGLKDKYEQYHNVIYTDDAIHACVHLSHRYIQDRFLPDKAIDLMDVAGSKLNLQSPTMSAAEIDEKLKQIAAMKDKALQTENYELAAKLRDEEKELKQQRVNSKEKKEPIVDVDLIQEIIAEQTGIPVGKLKENEQQKLKTIEQNLAQKVIGQEEAVKK